MSKLSAAICAEFDRLANEVDDEEEAMRLLKEYEEVIADLEDKIREFSESIEDGDYDDSETVKYGDEIPQLPPDFDNAAPRYNAPHEVAADDEEWPLTPSMVHGMPIQSYKETQQYKAGVPTHIEVTAVYFCEED